MVSPAWRRLGIAPTEDKRAIKRAYAAKLKATDVENDPRAFIELREALETATWEADYLQYQDHVGEPETAPEPGPEPVEIEPIRDEELAVAEAPGPVEDEYEPEDSEHYHPTYWRWEPERQPETEADQERIVELLWGEAPVDDIAVELAERTHKILTSPEMERIDHASAIEDWMASIIAQAIPRADTMARIVVPHFGWEGEGDDWRQRYGVSAAAARFRDLEALDRLARPDHRWHAAWTLLRQPPPDAAEWKRVAAHRAEILALIVSIRHHTPALEHELDANHVAQWEPALADQAGSTPVEGRTWGIAWYWWVFILLYGFLQLARGIGG